ARNEEHGLAGLSREVHARDAERHFFCHELVLARRAIDIDIGPGLQTLDRRTVEGKYPVRIANAAKTLLAKHDDARLPGFRRTYLSHRLGIVEPTSRRLTAAQPYGSHEQHQPTQQHHAPNSFPRA